MKKSCFNPRSYERSDVQLFGIIMSGDVFQSTLLRKERLCNFYGRRRKIYVSIHAPTKGATANPFNYSACHRFQSTLLRKERHQRLRTHGHWRKFQSTLLRKERHDRISYLNEMMEVSIHAPTKGATKKIINFKSYSKVSIHAPTKGATRAFSKNGLDTGFQSTLLRKERPIYDTTFKICVWFQSTLLRKERRLLI